MHENTQNLPSSKEKPKASGFYQLDCSVNVGHDSSERNFFPIGYSSLSSRKSHPFDFSQLKNSSEAEIWSLIKRFALQSSIFKGRFIGLLGKDGKVLTLSEFKVFIDQVDEQESLFFVIVKERFENIFTTIEERLNLLNSLINNKFSISALAKDASFTSNAIEGNTSTKSEYDASESEEEASLTLETKEIRVLKRMHERFQTDIRNGKVYTIDEELLLQVHKEMAVGLGNESGKFRSINVYVQGSTHKFPNHEIVISNLAIVLKTFHNSITSSKSLEDRIKAAIYLHYEIVNIHPFRDYNGRMARYMMNLVLFQYCRIPPTSIMPGIKGEYFASIREIDKNKQYIYLNTLITESIMRSIEKALYYTQQLDGMGLLLKRFSLEHLSRYCVRNNIKTQNYSKPEIIRTILTSSQQVGESAFVLEMEKSDLQSIVQEKGLSGFSKLQKCVEETLFPNPTSSNMKQFLSLFNGKVLDRFLELLRMKDDSSKEGKIKSIMEEQLILGLRMGFNEMNQDEISALCLELNIPSHGSKIENIYSMLGVVCPHYLTFKHLLFKENIWEIEQGVSLENLYQFYYLDLVKYATRHGLKVVLSSKQKMCKIILSYLEKDNLKRPNEENLKNNKKMKF